MKEQYCVLFQRGYEEENNKWLNGGSCYGMESYFDTLEEAENCRDYILKKEKEYNGTISTNGIGITIEYPNDEKDKYKLKRIIIKKRKVTDWEEV